MPDNTCRVCSGTIRIQIRKGTGLCSLKCEKKEKKDRGISEDQ
jgi:hypothetical protein